MNQLSFVVSLAAITGSTLIVATLNYLQLSTAALQQLSLVLMAILMVVLKWRLKNLSKSQIWQVAVLGLVSTLIQLLVVSTGGFLSPFLILFHLFALALAFLFSFKHSLIFLATSLLLLFGQLWQDSDAAASFLDDPGTTILYIISFLAVIPLAYLVHSQYHLKDVLLTSISDRLKATDTIIENLDDMVILTDPTGNILSANRAVEQYTGISSTQLSGRPFFDLFFMRTSDNVQVSVQSFKLQDLQKSMQSVSFSNLKLLAPNSVQARDIKITLTPVQIAAENLQQFTWVLHDADQEVKVLPISAHHERLLLYIQALLETLERQLSGNQVNLPLYLAILKHLQRDALLYDQLQAQSFTTTTAKVDLAQLCKRTIEVEQNYLASFGLKSQLNIPLFNDHQENQFLKVGGELQFSTMDVSGVYFTVDTDPLWASRLVELGLSLCAFLASETQASIALTLEQTQGSVMLNLSVDGMTVPSEIADLVFTPGYGSLTVTRKNYPTSGLEGYLFQDLCTKLLLTPKVSQQSHALTISLGFKTSDSLAQSTAKK